MTTLLSRMTGRQPAREVFGVYDRAGRCLYMHHGDSPALVDGGRAAWCAIWDNQEVVHDVAHTHPCGPHTFSAIDESSMAAIATGLGRPVRFWVLSPRWTVLRVVEPLAPVDRRDIRYDPGADNEPLWAARLRWESRMRTAPPPGRFSKMMERIFR